MRMIPPNSIWAIDLALYQEESSCLEAALTEVPKEAKNYKEILKCLFYSYISHWQILIWIPLIWKAIRMHSVQLPCTK